MNKSGFVYVLTNPSLPNLIKIGMTERDPVERAAELSTPTGVPTPFALIFKIHVSDRFEVERRAHLHLATKRRSGNREFFQVPVHEAITLLVEIARGFPPGQPSQTDDNEDQGPEVIEDNAAQFRSALERTGDAALAGIDTFQDFELAWDSYTKAAELDSSYACRRLAEMSSQGFGRDVDPKEAFNWFVRAAELGDDDAWLDAARVGFRSFPSFFRAILLAEDGIAFWEDWFERSQVVRAGARNALLAVERYLETRRYLQDPMTRLPDDIWQQYLRFVIGDGLPSKVLFEILPREPVGDWLVELQEFMAEMMQEVHLTTNSFGDELERITQIPRPSRKSLQRAEEVSQFLAYIREWFGRYRDCADRLHACLIVEGVFRRNAALIPIPSRTLLGPYTKVFPREEDILGALPDLLHRLDPTSENILHTFNAFGPKLSAILAEDDSFRDRVDALANQVLDPRERELVQRLCSVDPAQGEEIAERSLQLVQLFHRLAVIELHDGMAAEVQARL